MRIFNEVGRWYSIPCKILTQVIYVENFFKIHWKELELSSGHRPTDGRTDGRTDRRTDGRTDEQGESSIPPLNFVLGGIKRCDGQTDRQTDRRTDWTSHTAAWSQLKMYYNFTKVCSYESIWFSQHWFNKQVTSHHWNQWWRSTLMHISTA